MYALRGRAARRALALLTGLIAAPAIAGTALRDFCPARPGLATPPCVIDAGHVDAELGLADWTLDRSGGARSDTIVAGDLLLRYGLDASSEVQIGLTGFGRVRTREQGMVERASGVGDLILGYKRNLRNPDGSGFSVALQPFVTLPTGGRAIGAGDWGAGLVVPVSIDLGGAVGLGFSPEMDAAVDSDGKGRHLAYGSVAELGFTLSPQMSASIEVSEFRDEDPAGDQSPALAALSLAWQPAADWQLDVGTVAGLNRDSPHVELSFGISRRF